MKIKLNTSVRYIINDNNVIAIVKVFEIDEATQIATSLFQKINDYKLPNFTLPKEYKGIARYKSGDRYDLATAKIIARKKAMRLAYKTIKNYHFILYDNILKYLEKWEEYIASVSDKALQMTREIKELTGIEDN